MFIFLFGNNDLLFKIVALGIGSGTAGMFILINIFGSVYVYESIKWVLYLETAVSCGFVVWCIERLHKSIKGRS